MTKTHNPFFELLKTGLEEGIAHARGELTLKTFVHEQSAAPSVSVDSSKSLHKSDCSCGEIVDEIKAETIAQHKRSQAENQQ